MILRVRLSLILTLASIVAELAAKAKLLEIKIKAKIKKQTELYIYIYIGQQTMFLYDLKHNLIITQNLQIMSNLLCF